jgi:peptidoglycan hydrolase CwlO-like protein
MAATVVEIEERVTKLSEEYDEDPCFHPEEGFKQAIHDAISFKRDIGLTKQEMEHLVIKHDEEIRALRGVIHEQVGSMRYLEIMVKDQRHEIAHLLADSAQLRTDLEAVHDDNNALRKENAEMRAEMTQMREQMTAMQKEFDAYKKAHPM